MSRFPLLSAITTQLFWLLKAHRQTNPLALLIYFEHANGHPITNLDHIFDSVNPTG